MRIPDDRILWCLLGWNDRDDAWQFFCTEPAAYLILFPTEQGARLAARALAGGRFQFLLPMPITFPHRVQ